MSKAVLKIGAEVDKAGLEALTKSFVEILNTNCDEETKRCAINELIRIASVENINLSDMNVTGDRAIHVSIDGDGVQTSDE